jgi:hypothetical protein
MGCGHGGVCDELMSVKVRIILFYGIGEGMCLRVYGSRR